MSERQAELVVLDDLVTAEPGQSARTRVRLRNVGDRVVRYTLTAVPSSPAAAWITIAPDSVSLLESDDGEADVFLQPPLDAGTAAGRIPFAIMADPGPDSGLLPVVAEADLAVGAVHALDCRLVPTQGSGRLRGRLRAEFTNLGNEDVRVAVTANDDADGENLHFATAEGRITVPAGRTADVFIKVRPDKPTLIGKPVAHPFVVTYSRRAGRTARLNTPTVNSEVEAEINGTWTQKPVIAKWMIGVALLAMVIGAVVFMYRRANAADPPRRAPAVPLLDGQAVITAEGMLRFTLATLDSPALIESVITDAPPAGALDVAKPLGPVEVQQDVASLTPIEMEVPEDAGDEVFFRFRAQDDDGRYSRWQGGSIFRPDVERLDTPEVTVTWANSATLSVSWTVPANLGDRSLEYNVRRDGSEQTVSETSTELSIPADARDAQLAIEVRAFDKDDPDFRSEWSEPQLPSDERPATTAISPPANVQVRWLDTDSVLVTWEEPPDRGDRSVTYVLRQNPGGSVLDVAQVGLSAEVPMPGDVFGIEVAAVLAENEVVDAEANRSSGFTTPELPEGERPTPTTPPPPPTTAPPTTLPEPDTPRGFWVAPQGPRGPSVQEELEWGVIWTKLVNDGRVARNLARIDFASEEFELPAEFNARDGQIFVIAEGFETGAAAFAACGEFLSELAELNPDRAPAECSVYDQSNRLFDSVPVPAPTTTTSTTTTLSF